MKRFWMITLVLGLVVGFGLATAFSAAYAQSSTPQNPQGVGPWGQGMMNGRGGMMGGRGSGMMGGFAQQDGVHGTMHAAMTEALAAKLGLTKDAYDKLWSEGQTFWQIAEAQGFTNEEAQQMMTDARTVTLDKMVADGVITQPQADLMKTRMSGGSGAGAGGCQGGGRGMRGSILP